VHIEIINYLKKNINKFEIQVLKNELLKSGHSEEDINEALHQVIENKEKIHTENIAIFPAPTKEYSKPEIKKETNTIKEIDPVPLSLEGLEDQEEIHPFHKGIRKYYTHTNLVIFISLLAVLSFLTVLFLFFKT